MLPGLRKLEGSIASFSLRWFMREYFLFSTMDAQLALALVITIVVTTLLVRGWSWILRAKDSHPELYRRRYAIRTVILLLLHSGDI